MAGSNQLVIGVGADTSKSTADLARAQAKVADFGKELRAAAKAGDDESVDRISKQYDAEIKNVSKLKDAVRSARAAATEGDDEALKTRQDLAKLNVNLPAQTIGEALERIKPGNQDIFSKLGVSVFNSTDKVRGLTDALADFLDAFATKDPSERIRIVTETMGKGFAGLIPLMSKGRAGMFEFLDAA